MPEGPEVERMRQRIAGLAGQTVTLSVARDGKKFMSSQQAAPYQNHKVVEVARRGKRLGIVFDNNLVIAVGAGMSGSWRVSKLGSEPHKHEMFALESAQQGLRYAFTDVRCYGFVKPTDSHWADDIGVDFTSSELLEDGIGDRLKQRYQSKTKRLPIKAALLDQSIIAGIGNIYASELLWELQVHPETLPANFTKYAELAQRCHNMLLRAVNGKNSVDQSSRHVTPGGFVMQVYDRAGEPCSRCGTKISHSRLVGRSTYWCSTCQPI